MLLYRRSPKFYHVRTVFVTDWAQKTFLTKLVLKRSVLQQSLPNSHHNLFPSKPTPASVASVGAALCLKIHFFFEGCYMEAAQNFFEGRTRFVTDWAQKTALTKLVLKRSVLQQSLPNFHHNLF